MSIHWPIIRKSLLNPLDHAFVDDMKTWKRIELIVAACLVADEIDRRTSEKMVGVMLPTSGAFGVVALACWMTGRTIVPLNYLLKKDDIEFLIEDSGIDYVVTSKRLLNFLGFTPDNARFECMEDMDLGGVPEPRIPAFTDDSETAVILYTSGTSGKPKGVVLTHGNLKANVKQCIEHAGWDECSTMVGVLPQFHSFGLTVLTVLPMMLGSKVVYTARFVPGKIAELIKEHKPVAFIGIPSMYAALARVKDASPADFRSLELAISGGEPLPSEVAEAFEKRFGIRITEGYGLTETAPVSNICMPHYFAERSVGKPVPRLEQRIVGFEGADEGRTMPTGKEGEIRMRGPNVMPGYYKRPEETAAAFDDQGFFRTGDVGKFDEQGRLYITGRIKEMMIVGGENVFPREIEEVLLRHPAIAACGVVGKPDGVRGEVPVAYVERNDDEPFDAAEIRSWLRERIAGYKVPKEITVVDELPRGPTGKVTRRELMKRAAEESAPSPEPAGN